MTPVMEAGQWAPSGAGDPDAPDWQALTAVLPQMSISTLLGLERDIWPPFGPRDIACTIGSNRTGEERLRLVRGAVPEPRSTRFLVASKSDYSVVLLRRVEDGQAAPVDTLAPGDTVAGVTDSMRIASCKELIGWYGANGALNGVVTSSGKDGDSFGWALSSTNGALRFVVTWVRPTESRDVLREQMTKALSFSKFPADAVDLTRAQVRLDGDIGIIEMAVVDAREAWRYIRQLPVDPLLGDP